MGNLGQREKYGLGLVAILIVAFVIYFAGIRNNQTNKEILEAQRNELNARIVTLENLKNNNDQTLINIREVEDNIKEIEKTFMPVLNTESIQQFVLSTFEAQGCPYLNTTGTTMIGADAIILPNGAVAPESLNVLRISVQYVTSDGFNVGQYNMNPDFMAMDTETFEEEVLSLYGDDTTLVYDPNGPLQEYNAFINALKVLENTGVPEGAEEGTPSSCIRINNVKMSTEAGYMVLSADIDFYSATFTNRLSEADLSAPYITWSGRNPSSIARGGEMGRRFLFVNDATKWNMVIMTDSDAMSNARPFAAYWANELFNQNIASRGGLLYALYSDLSPSDNNMDLGLDGVDPNAEVNP